ncbi:uncharacterized protein LOC105212777 isoform X1 [Zeugodacus cucurbitae]|uniref:uncharacterized protein LOC105212777 isoform X1 n=1 Tax=Zeugodacus cucurbitae TaxID=28588 RepID=UPI0005967A48|nr:uncharacterized protein LOC105212777 isoform X1 [Zeugodacus cucurbitae]
MSEVENNQETNGTSNGDVPEIELIIKEEFMLENEIEGNASELNINGVTGGDGLHDVDEKENIVKSNLQHIKECKTTNSEKVFVQRKDAFAKHRNEFLDGVNVLMLTHHDNQHFQFEYVTSKQDENVLDTLSVVEQHTTCYQIDEKLNSENLSINHMSRVPFAQKHMEDEVVVKGEFPSDNNPVSNIDFAAMVAEACEGIFDEIENDLRAYSNNSDNNEQFSDSACHSQARVVKRKKRAHNSEAVQQAANAVLEGRMSLGEAAKCYNVVRSTVSSRVAKHPKRKRRKSNKQLEELIYSKLKAGVQISEISRSLHVPKSTVHLYKTRLKDNGLLPPVWIRNGSKDMVDHGVQERLLQAYRGHIVNGMSVRFAAEFYSLPLTTLWRYIKRRKDPTMNVDDHLTKSEMEECIEGENYINNPTNDFEDIEIEKNLQINEMKSHLSPASYPKDLEPVIEKKEQTIEQSLISQLLD